MTLYKPKNLDWWNPISDFIILCALPLTPDHCKHIATQVKAVLSVVESLELKGIGFFKNPVTEADWIENGVQQKLLSVVDRSAPTQEQIKEGVEFIHMKVTEGLKVYVHSKAGKGRSAAIVICYLMHHQKLSFDLAFMKVKKCRPIVSLTWGQIEAVKNYERTHSVVSNKKN